MVAIINGWTVYAHPCFQDVYDALVAEVTELKRRFPDTYQQKKATKLLAVVHQVIEQGITVNPANPAYAQGRTLGDKYLKWSRAKFGAARYRLFFRYSLSQKVIVLGWMNDETTLRAYHSKTDAYEVFRKMLRKKRPPTDWEVLIKESVAFRETPAG